MEVKPVKYTCSCCGYKTLASNVIHEICPVCHWEKDDGRDLFGSSEENLITLYEAQKNYQKFGCFNKKYLNFCRRPLEDEKKDSSWLSIQEIIKKEYDSTSKLINKIHVICALLKRPDAVTQHRNFLALDNLEYNDEATNSYFIEYQEKSKVEQFKNQLLLDALAAILSKSHADQLVKLFCEYYNKGLSYYAAWSIMLSVLTELPRLKLDANAINIFLDIEQNNYYGLNKVEAAVKKYWNKGCHPPV